MTTSFDAASTSPSNGTPTPGSGPEFEAGRPHYSLLMRSLAMRVRPLARPLAGTRFFPLWAVLSHTGRRSGTTYDTPVVARPIADGFLIPLPFGDATQWARNLFASGTGSLRYAGRDWAIRDPEIVDHQAANAGLGPILAFVSGRIGLRQYVRVRRVDAA